RFRLVAVADRLEETKLAVPRDRDHRAEIAACGDIRFDDGPEMGEAIRIETRSTLRHGPPSPSAKACLYRTRRPSVNLPRAVPARLLPSPQGALRDHRDRDDLGLLPQISPGMK